MWVIMSEDDSLHVLYIALVLIMEDVGLVLVQNLNLQGDNISILPAVEDQRNPWYWLTG